MLRQYAFLILAVLAIIYALVRGGQPERYAAIMYLLAYAASSAAAVYSSLHFSGIEVGIFLIDAVLAASLTILALRANRYWTIWASSLQVISVMAHISQIFLPDVIAPAYAITLIIWSYLALVCLMIATYRHRIRLKIYGVDPSWTAH